MTKKIWKKIITHLLTVAMLVSMFTFVDMGWNVIDAQAATYDANSLKKNDYLKAGDYIKYGDKISITVNGGPSTYESGTDIQYQLPNLSSYPGKCCYQVTSITKGGGIQITVSSVAHSGIKVAGTTATCTSAGYKDAWKCTVTVCNNYFSNSAYTASIGNQSAYDTWKSTGEGKIAIDANNHDWSGLDGICKRDSSHTCKHEGQTGKATCAICGIPLHTHGNFEYTATGNKITATCTNTGCTVPAENKTITINQTGGSYTGAAYEATIDGLSAFNTLTSQSISVSDVVYYKDGATIEGSPINAGDYTAKITVDGQTAEKSFSITKIDPVVEDFTYTAPSSLTYNGSAKTATVVANAGKTNGTITVKYYDSSDAEVTSPIEMGDYKVKITVTEGDNFNAVTSPMQVGTFTIVKGSYNGEKTAAGTLYAKTGKTVDITLPSIPDGANYGAVDNGNTGFFSVSAVSDGKVTVTSAKDWDEATENESKTFTVPVTGATKYNDYNITVTVTPRFHVHSLTLIPGKEQTDEEDGWKDYYQCSGDEGCEEYFEDAEGTVLISDLEAWKVGAGILNAKVKHHKENEESNFGQSTISSGITDNLTDEISAALAANKNVSVWIEATDAAESAPEEDLNQIKQNVPQSYQVGAVIDVKLLQQIEGLATAPITETSAPIKVKVGIPSDILKSNREYKVMRVHSGTVDVLPTTRAGNDIIFESDRFSIYSIIYSDIYVSSGSHSHEYEWENGRGVSKVEDGVKVYKCRICGHVLEEENIPAYAYACYTESERVLKAGQNASIVCDMDRWNVYPRWFFEKLATRPDVNITLKFIYEHKQYTVYIPAGTKIDTSCEWYGPLKVTSLYKFEVK